MFRFSPLNACTRQECRIAEAHPDNRKRYSISDYIERAISIETVADLHAFANKIKLDFGYSIFGGAIAFNCMDELPTLHYMCDGNTEWVKYYRKNLIAVDPIVPQISSQVTPIIWKMSKYMPTLVKASPLMARAVNDFNIDGFVAIPLHGKDTAVSAIRFAYTKDSNLENQDIEYSLPILAMISTYMYEALVRILQKGEEQKTVRLSKREIEILSWVANGKSSWAISQILKISENTVLTHLKRIHIKLGVNTRQHAVAKAISSRLI